MVVYGPASRVNLLSSLGLLQLFRGIKCRMQYKAGSYSYRAEIWEKRQLKVVGDGLRDLLYMTLYCP